MVAAAFDRFNTNGDGMLDLEEVRYMLDAAGFEADSEYVLGIGRMFGSSAATIARSEPNSPRNSSAMKISEASTDDQRLPRIESGVEIGSVDKFE